ncbi:MULTISPECIES: type III-B CRISPR module-associated protein Cmr5 [Acinetobacter]|jgi:CRISPR-associated protein Cmr5|uniref:type III-B CRISPR module-associated protein Cmr5 n=2 Tax=Acinetobacter TaxID=469 RepID=UPI00141B56FC|nr:MULTISPECIES: type III-B CRISPR module-associated protein Cmr5 [Acinetobacter]MDI1224022.1 type III-B CRISPR module-associated protein Cmr5 [Acinetobacter sp.]
MMQIRTHKYAELAYPLVESMQNVQFEAKYRTLALNLPTMIMQSGLAQTIGFLMAKSKEEHRSFLDHIATLLNFNTPEDFHKAILKSNITQYQLLTRKSLDAASWLKRYTQALLNKEAVYD